MKLSTKGQYGARAMLELALNYDKEYVLLREIAQKQNISERYLERIMAGLVSAGVIRSARGKHGGFRLAKPPAEIKLSQIIELTEGSLAPVGCVDDAKLCERADGCIMRDIWGGLKGSMFNLLESISLENMVEMHKEKINKPKTQMYYI